MAPTDILADIMALSHRMEDMLQSGELVLDFPIGLTNDAPLGRLAEDVHAVDYIVQNDAPELVGKR